MPARVQSKLLAAFLAIVMLLIIVGAVGLQVLNGVNERTGELIKLQRKIEAYRQVQHDTTSQLYSVSTALLFADDQSLSSTLRQLNQFGYDVDRLEFVARDEVELIWRPMSIGCARNLAGSISNLNWSASINHSSSLI
jgi:CHASE3 domain sensor protein